MVSWVESMTNFREVPDAGLVCNLSKGGEGVARLLTYSSYATLYLRQLISSALSSLEIFPIVTVPWAAP